MKARDIREMDRETIVAKIDSLKKELLDLRIKKASAGVEQTHKFKELKRDIARLNTVLREMELNKAR